MNDTIRCLMEKPYHIAIVRDEDDRGQVGWVASVAELPGCLSQGDTPEEAMTNILEAMSVWFESMLEDGKQIPPPSPEAAYSGKLLLRLPPSLHARLAWEAEHERLSLNQFLMAVLSGAVGWNPGWQAHARAGGQSITAR